MNPEQWRDRLYARLLTRASQRDVYQRYYDGCQDLPRSSTFDSDSAEARAKYAKFSRESMTNWCALVVDATVERQKIVGFRFSEPATGTGAGPAVDETEGNDDAWAIWQASRLDSDAKLSILDAAVVGSSFMLCWPTGATEDGQPKVTITTESGVQCIVEYEDGSRWKRAAGLKSWSDCDGNTYATLYLPDATYKWISKGPSNPTAGFKIVGEGTLPKLAVTVDNWEKRVVPDEAWPLAGFGVVPLVELRPRPEMNGESRSELSGGVIWIQDRINDTTFNRLVAGEYGAFLQRWATGLEVAVDPETGKPISPFKIGADQLWWTSDAESKFGQFDATELKNYIDAIESDVTHLAAITKTPPHYLLGALINSSGDALTASETGLVAKVRDRMAFTGEDLEEVMRTAFKIAGDDVKANDFGCEVLWADPEKRSMAELADACLKLLSIGVPREVLWARIGASPQEIKEWKDMATEDAIRLAIAQAPPQGQPQPTAPQPRSLPASPPEAVIAGG